MQEVFVECFRAAGTGRRLNRRTRADSGNSYGCDAERRTPSRARHVRRRLVADFDPDALPGDDESLSLAFDRAWARALLGEAARLQAQRAAAVSSAALQRVELLRLRFQAGMPPRDIARLWKVDAAEVYREYDTARDEFRDCLRAVTAWTGTPTTAFAYPNGQPGVDYTADTIALLRDSGVDVAFTTRAGFAGPREAAFEQPRFVMLAGVSASELAHRLAYSWRRIAASSPPVGSRT